MVVDNRGRAFFLFFFSDSLVARNVRRWAGMEVFFLFFLFFVHPWDFLCVCYRKLLCSVTVKGALCFYENSG